MFNESKHKQEVPPREERKQRAQPSQLLRLRPLATRQPQLPAMRVTNRSICLKQLRKPAEVAEELEAPVEDALEE